jgi:hypothetical protein
VNSQRALPDLPDDLICECAKADCTERVTLNAVEYRAYGRVIAPADEHFFPEVERVVAKNGHYWVVEKHNGAARIPEELDPR